MFHQLSLVLALFDIIACVSTLRQKDGEDNLCRTQEYMLQLGLLGKAATTLTICHVSTRTLRDMEILSTKFVFSHLGCALLGVVACMGISIFFDSAFLWCGGNEFAAFDLESSRREIVYMTAFLLPILLCVVVNCYYYFSISSDIQGRRLTRRACNTTDTLRHTHTEEAKLYRVIKHILFYPIMLAICFIPEVAAVVHTLVTGHFSPVLYRLATVFLGLNGFFMAINYFRQQKLHPNLQKITFSLQAPVFFVGRNVSSLMAWSEGPSESTMTANPMSMTMAGESSAIGSSSSGVALTDSSYFGDSSFASGMEESSATRGSDMSDRESNNFTVFFK